jgi:prolyl-tRNA editing enzyme YbaK/EbsC (Cys-tRNA(Pro) deacylase)
MREKVAASARELGLHVDVQRLEVSTRTVEDAAQAVGCGEAEIAKSLVFLCDGEPVLCIASGEHRVDPEKLALVFDCAVVSQASPDEVRAATGFPVGGVPPFGHDLPVVVDEALLRHKRVWAAGGDGQSLFCVDPHELVSSTGAQVAPVGE